MTYLLISKDKDTLQEYLLQFTKEITGKEIINLENDPDIHILDSKESNSLGIEEVKEFVSHMKYMPFGNGVQIAIILESEKLTVQAQNSLLKTLEESSDTTIYILCVDNEKNLLPTIISRSKSKYVHQEYKEEHTTKPEILEKNLVEQFKYIEDISKEKTLTIQFIQELEGYCKNMLELEIKNGKIESSRIILDKAKHIQEAKTKIEANCNKRLVLEALILYLNT